MLLRRNPAGLAPGEFGLLPVDLQRGLEWIVLVGASGFVCVFPSIIGHGPGLLGDGLLRDETSEFEPDVPTTRAAVSSSASRSIAGSKLFQSSPPTPARCGNPCSMTANGSSPLLSKADVSSATGMGYAMSGSPCRCRVSGLSWSSRRLSIADWPATGVLCGMWFVLAAERTRQVGTAHENDSDNAAPVSYIERKYAVDVLVQSGVPTSTAYKWLADHDNLIPSNVLDQLKENAAARENRECEFSRRENPDAMKNS